MRHRSTIMTVLLIAFVGVLFLGPVSPAWSQDHEHDHDHGQEETHAEEQTDEATKSPYEIHFNTHPKPDDIVPDDSMTELMFEVTHDGEPASDAELSYRVYTPPETFWFSTDFPLVEGTQLLSGSVPVPQGHQVISMILPIRGEYHVKATARGPDGVTTKQFDFDVSENPQEVINLSIFLFVLFLIGGIGGFVFSSARIGSSTPSSWLIALFLAGVLVTLGSPAAVQAHGQGSWDPHTLDNQKGVMTLDEKTKLHTELFPQPVQVGEMLNVRYQVETANNTGEDGHGTHGHAQHGPAILAESHFVHSGGGLEMVTQSSWLDDGRGEINVQLFDGAPHYLVTRFYRPTEVYKPAGGHDHGHGEQEPGHDEEGHEEHGDHSHGNADPVEPSWESEVAYSLDAGEYTVRFHESGDPAMKWLLLPEDTDNRLDEAKHGMESCESIEAGATIPGDTNCYNLTLNPDGTSFTLEVNNPGEYRLFTQHLPREFDMTIQSPEGDTLTPGQKFVTGKGEFLGRSVKWVNVNGISPPFDDIMKAMLTLLFVTGLGVFVGFKGPEMLS